MVESQGVKLVYDKELEDYVKDTVIDYSDDWYNRGFSITSGAISSC